MGFVDAVKTVYTNYVNFQGRSGRAEFWWFFLFFLIVGIVLIALGRLIGAGDLLYNLFALASLLPSLGVGVRRLHDTGHSGWWILLSLIPLIGFIILIIMSYARASDGPNKFGAPAEGGAAAADTPPSSDGAV